MSTEEDLIQERRMYNRSVYPTPYPQVYYEETMETKKPGAIAVVMSVSGFSDFVTLHFYF